MPMPARRMRSYHRIGRKRFERRHGIRFAEAVERLRREWGRAVRGGLRKRDAALGSILGVGDYAPGAATFR